MTIESIKAKVRCDGCNKVFDVVVDDGAYAGSLSLHDLVWNVVANNPDTSEKGDHLLCAYCTNYIDEKFGDDNPEPTYDQVKKVFDERAGI